MERLGCASPGNRIKTTRSPGGEEALRIHTTHLRRVTREVDEVEVAAGARETEEAGPVVITGEVSRFGVPRSSANRMR